MDDLSADLLAAMMSVPPLVVGMGINCLESTAWRISVREDQRK